MKAGVSLMQSTIYDYFAQHYKKLEAKITAIEQKYKIYTKKSTENSIKTAKNPNDKSNRN